VTARPAMPSGLSRAYLLVLAPAAFLAPLPLLWTGGASRKAILLFELFLAALWWRARQGRPVRVSDALMNLAGLGYMAWLAVSAVKLRQGLLPSVVHLLLFTGLAKLASLKRPSEARLALLVIFLLTLASASTSTHVASVLYFAAAAWVGFRALGRIAVLADFDEAPPDRVLAGVPTRGLTAVALVAGALCAAPLFFLLPRLHSPFALAPFRIDDAVGRALASDRVDLQSFGAAKQSDRVILRLSSEPALAPADALRLREAIFTDYLDGVWTRDPRVGTRRGDRAAHTFGPAAASPKPAAVVAVDLNVVGQGFLFLPYGAAAVRVERGRAMELPDGVMQVASGRGPVRYEADVQRAPARGAGRGAILAADVPGEIQKYALELTAGLDDPKAIARRIEEHFAKTFVYTLDPPRGEGDPLVHFLLHSKAGHCEYFASAGAMMLAARGIPARLVTGSYGGEDGFLSRTVVVRAQNLHAWVEADLDGTGFQVFDPTPAAGVPPLLRAYSFASRLYALGREIEFFYDRRVLGFDAGDQAGAVEAARESLAEAAGNLAALKQSVREALTPGAAAGFVAAGLAAWLLLRLTARARDRHGPATRAYLSLRRLVGRRRGAVAPSTPPAEVARLFALEVPEGADDARAVVDTYCASAFGSIEPDADGVRELTERVRRLRKGSNLSKGVVPSA
jgi:transglutaminase-like putative cysteine protease